MIQGMDTIKQWFNGDNRTKTLTIIGLIVLVVVGGYFLISKKAFAPSDFLGDDNATTTPNTLGTSTSNTIRVATQNPGMQVLVQSVSFSTPGWIAIYTDNEGEPQSIIGAQYFMPGTHSNVSVEVFAGMTAGATYYAVLHSDDGATLASSTAYGSHPFDHTKDLPITKGDKTWVMAPFQITSTGSRG